MQLPFRREALAERDRLDREEDEEAARAESPGARAELTLELSELSREIAEAAGAGWLAPPPGDLEGRAELYALPLARLCPR